MSIDLFAFTPDFHVFVIPKIRKYPDLLPMGPVVSPLGGSLFVPDFIQCATEQVV